ncbi:hypothetical protein DJ533_08660 [Acinetobacter defluvii]|uniref:Uncharacterized protein n=1 Tax=Acinetobacter defluvii TaxID=1871111 RepID=A0A2S2FCL2_9GAMM|nr:hypothetical protein [Acinetobacter defluvii]AWL28630.1 hypothetical protein DJ533_08660 [Acinetobacter defluvii]
MGMELKKHTQNPQRYLFGILLSCMCSTAFSISPIKDEVLATDVDYVGTITPLVITAVKRDVQNSVEHQNETNHQLADQQSNAIKKDHLAYVVLNDYEQQRQEAHFSESLVQKKPLIPNKAKVTEYGISVLGNTITVHGEDKITIYTSQDAH